MAAISARQVPASPSFGWDRVARFAFEAAGWLLLGIGALAVAVATLGPAVFGWQFAVVRSGSMEPAIHTGSVAVFTDVPAEGVYRGDIVIYHLADGTRVTHRVASLTADGTAVITKGDANRVADAEPVSVGAIEGKFLFSVPYAGYLAAWVRNPIGFAGVVFVPGIIVISLSLASIFRVRANQGRPSASNPGASDRIVRYPQPGGEDETVRFPLRRHHEAPEQPAAEPSEPVPFAPQAVREPEPAPLPPTLEPAERLAPRSASTQAAPAQPVPALQIPLRGQSTGTDARAERLVRAIRGEVEELRETLDQLASGRAEFLEADLEAIIADPQGAASLPAPVLIRALLMANERNEELESELERKTRLASKLKGQLRDIRIEQASGKARLETLEEVIAALHANLEDLRSERELSRRLAAPANVPQQLRAAPEPLPPARPALVDRE
jgi:signal peptidase